MKVSSMVSTLARYVDYCVFAGFSLTNMSLQHLSSKGITAEQWTGTVCDIIGGKAGGKEPTRQGSGTQPEKLDEAVTKAEKWLLEKMGDLKI